MVLSVDFVQSFGILLYSNLESCILRDRKPRILQVVCECISLWQLQYWYAIVHISLTQETNVLITSFECKINKNISGISDGLLGLTNMTVISWKDSVMCKKSYI